MCVIAIKQRNVKFPSYDRVKNMCDNNDDGFAIVYHVNGQPVKNYRTLNKDKFLDKYREITSLYNDEDVALFIHARLKTHGSEKLDNCHGWIDDSIGMSFAHNGILSIKNRDDLTDSETFFRDLFVPIFTIGGWDAGIKAINSVIGTSKFVFMDFHGEIFHFGNYINGDDGILYSNSTYSYSKNKWDKYGWYGNSYSSKSKTTPAYSQSYNSSYDSYDVWDNNTSWWDNGNAPF